MRILCVGIEAAPAAEISASLGGEAVTCLPDQLDDVLTDKRGFDAILLSGHAFDRLNREEGAVSALRAKTVETTWMVVGDEADDAFYAGIDSVLDSDAEVDAVAEEAFRAIRTRRATLRWPKGFIERRIVVAAPKGARIDDIADAGFIVTTAQDAGVLTAIRRADHHAALLDARASIGPVSRLIEAIKSYNPTIGVAAYVQTKDAVDAARLAGAAVVRMGVLGGDVADVAEQAWLSWCRAQPVSVERPRVKVVGNIGPLEDTLHEIGWVGPSDGPTIILAGADQVDAIDGDDVAILVRRERAPKRSLRRQFVAELTPDSPPGALSEALRLAEGAARQNYTIHALARRLHEVDARRVDLLKRLADAQLELDNLATFDSLTETFNHRGIEDALAREMEHARRVGGTVAGCLIEIDDETGVHERYGFRAGDDIIRKMAERLKEGLRVTDVIGRVGEDAFLLLLPQTRTAEAIMVAERACEAVTETPVVVGDDSVDLAIASGVAVLPWDAARLEEALPLLRSAVRQKRDATGQGDRVRDTEVDELADTGSLPEAAQLDALVEGLLTGEGLIAVAQPIVRVSDEVTAGYEMLIRGRESLLEAPQKLLRFARHRGVLTKVDLKCMQTCVDAAARLASHLLICVNLFPTTLLDVEVEDVMGLFESAEDARICLELSEEQFIGDPRELSDRIAALRSAGVRLAIDDVGRGRGTLDSVMLLEPDIVKIDKELISGASRDTRKERLLRRLVTLAVTLGCEVVGEGVEKAEDLALLRELDVPYAQGFLWSEPSVLDAIPAADSRPSLSSNPPS